MQPPAPADGVVVVDLVAEARLAAARPAIAMFNVNGTSYTCQNAVKKLLELQRSSPIEGWRAVEVCTEGEGEARKPKLKCKHCNSLMSLSNPAQSLKTHMSERACKGLKRLATAAAAAQMAAGNGGGSSSTSTGSGAGVATAGDGAGTATTNPILGKRKKGGSVNVATAEMRRGWWDVHSTHFPLIADAAIRLLSFHVTSCATERNWSVWGRLCTKTTNRRLLERAAKLVTIMTSGESAAVQADEDEELMALLSKES